MTTETNVEGATAQASEATQEVSQAAQENAGFQRRIDELTAARRQAEAEAAAQRDLAAKLLEQMQQLQERAVQPPPANEPDYYSELGDAGRVVKQAVESAVKRTQDALTRQFSEQYSRLESQMQMQALQAQASVSGLPAEVASRAAAVLNGARQRGLPLTPDDALKWAYGEALMAGQVQPQSTRRPGSPAGAALGAANPPMPTNGTQRPPALPANFESMRPAEQDAWLAKNGLDSLDL